MKLWSSLKNALGGEPAPVAFAPGDPEMARAKQAAKQTLGSFWSAYEAHAAYDNFLLKVSVPAVGGEFEHLWLERIERDENRMSGLVTKRPVHPVVAIREGDRLEFSEDQVVDWTYAKNGRHFGQFTTRLMLKGAGRAALHPDVARDMEASLSPKPLEQAP